MKFPAPILLTGACFMVAALAGWQLRPPDRTIPDAEPATVSGKASQRAANIPGKTSMPEDVRQRLAVIHAASTPEERLRATLALAHSLPLSEMESWYQSEWFGFHLGMDSNVFYRITRARWLAKDPEGLMTFFLRRNDNMTHDTASRWASMDPHAASLFMEGVTDQGDLQKLISAMARPLAETNPALALAQLERLHSVFGEDRSQPLYELVDALAESAPAQLETESTGWPSALQHYAARQLLVALLGRDFPSAVAGLQDSPDGKKRFLEAVSGREALMKVIAKDPAALPDGWFAAAVTENYYYVVNQDPGKWLDTDLSSLGFDDSQAERIEEYALSQLCRTDTARALALLQSDTLDPQQHRSLFFNTLSHLVHTDGARAEAWVGALTDPLEIEQARRYLLADAASKSPPRPAEWLAGLIGEEDLSPDQHAQRIQGWDHAQIATAAQEFRTLSADQKSAIAPKLVQAMSSGVPTELYAEAVGHLIEARAMPDADADATDDGSAKDLISRTSYLASAWGREDPAAAGRWVRSLPPGDERLWAAKNLAAQWAEYEPAAARQWAAGLPADERQQVVEYLDTGSAQQP